MRKRNIALVLALCLAAAAAHAKEVEVSQKSKTFTMQKSAVQTMRINVGDTVVFRNDDPFFHNVYSTSKTRDFDLGSYPQGQSRKVVFEKEGTVDVECAIHPDMKLRIDVVK